MTSPAFLTPDFQKALDAYDAGKPVSECAAIAGISTPTLRKRLRALGRPERHVMNPDAAALDEAIRAYIDGATVAKCAKIAGIGAETFRNVLRKRGVDIRDRGQSARRIPTPSGLIEDYLGGMSVKAVARKYGLERSPVYRMLAERGINGRDRSEAMQLRWQRASAAQRRDMLKGAHAASRGRQVPSAERAEIALAKDGRVMSTNETTLGALVADLGYDVAYGVPCGPYNIDIVIAGTVAVEVFGGQWHEYGVHRANFGERARHVLDAGYSLAIVWTNETRYAVSVQCAQHLGTLTEITRGHPAIGRQYWVIRGDGHFLAVCEDKGDEVPFIASSGSRDR